MNVREVLVNMALWVRRSLPKFPALRHQSSHEGARKILVRPGTCLISPVVFASVSFLGISNTMLCYGLRKGGFHENDGNREDDDT